MGKLNVYDLSRNFWDFAFENPSKIKPTHCALYFFAIEHCNRLGWKRGVWTSYKHGYRSYWH